MDVAVTPVVPPDAGYTLPTVRVRTDANGNYKVSAVPPGEATVYFGSTATLKGEYWSNATTRASATKVTVKVGATRSGVNAALARK